MEILSPGKKLRKIRKDLKIRQHEITGGEITRELISIIENDKCNMTSSVAEILVSNINRICRERNIEFNLSVDYLMESVKEQTNKIADEYLKYLAQNENDLLLDFSDFIKKIDLFLMEYEVSEKRVLLYEKIADILRNQKKFENSFTYYVKAYESYYKVDDEEYLFNLLQKLGNVCIYLARYNECLYFNDLAVIHSRAVSEDLKYKVLFNNALCYARLKQYDKALEELDNIENISDKMPMERNFKVKSLKANCFRLKNFYNDALELNKELLKLLEESDYENHILIMSNILETYTTLNDKKNIKKYLDKLTQVVNKSNEVDYTTDAYRQMGYSYNVIGEKDLAKEYYRKSLKVCKKFRNKNIVEDLFNELLNILLKEQDLEGLSSLKNEVLEFVTLELLNKNSVLILNLIDYYNNIGDNDTISGLLGFLLQNQKKAI